MGFPIIYFLLIILYLTLFAINGEIISETDIGIGK